jgi:hypothetical protein
MTLKIVWKHTDDRLTMNAWDHYLDCCQTVRARPIGVLVTGMTGERISTYQVVDGAPREEMRDASGGRWFLVQHNNDEHMVRGEN